MKNKRYSTEDKIRILRQVDQGRSVVEVCQEHNLSQVSFYRKKGSGKRGQSVHLSKKKGSVRAFEQKEFFTTQFVC